jgi:N-acetylmuramic acid 6-phosphate (MurNAc-6-P) etherase
MLLALTVSGKTPWVWGAMRHAWSLGAPIAVVTQQAASEAAQLADIIIAPQTGPEAVAGFGNPKARIAQRQILTMLTTGLAIREGRVYENLRVDLQANTPHEAERQIAIVMAATGARAARPKPRWPAAISTAGRQYSCSSAGWMPGRRASCWQSITIICGLRYARRRRLPELNPTARISTIRAG